MVSPELLRRYPFFRSLDAEQTKQVAMLSEEIQVKKGEVIFEEGAPANNLYLLLHGAVELIYTSAEAYHPTSRKEFGAGEINPGEIFGLSSLIGDSNLTATARAAKDCSLVQIDALALRSLFTHDNLLGYYIMTEATRAALERMAGLRTQLAAAWS